MDKDDCIKAEIFGFAQGEELSEHTASMPTILPFLQGEAKITLGDDAFDAKPGTWVHMPTGLRHSIPAKTPVVMLLPAFSNSPPSLSGNRLVQFPHGSLRIGFGSLAVPACARTPLWRLQTETDQVILHSQDRQRYAITEADHISERKIENHWTTSLQRVASKGAEGGDRARPVATAARTATREPPACADQRERTALSHTLLIACRMSG